MLHLALLDWVVIVAFVVAILALGFSAKLQNNTLLAYLVAGRSLSLPAFVATLVSTWYGGILAIGDSVKAYGLGTFLLLGVPYYAFAILYAFVFAKRVRGVEQISIPERLGARFGRSAALTGAVLIFLLAVPAAHVLMLGTLLHLFTGWGIVVSVVVATLGGTLFLYRGGLLADVRVGLLAFLMMYVGFVVIVGWCVTHESPSHLVGRLDPSLLHWDGGQSGLAIASFFVLGAWTLVDPGFHQRVSSAATPELGKRGVLISTVFWFLFDLLSITTGMYAIATLSPDAGGLSFFPELGDRVLPAGLKGVFFCGMLGTILSAMVGYTLVSGATFGREFMGRLIRNPTDARLKAWTRVGFMLACVVAIALAVQVKNVVVDLWYAYSGAVVGGLLLPVCLAYLPQLKVSAPRRWVAASMIIAFAIGFGWMIEGKTTNNSDLNVSFAGQTFSLGTLAPGLLASAVVLGLGEVVGRRV